MTDKSPLLHDFDPNLPLARAKTIPARWYFDPEILKLEQRQVFAGTWQCVARKDQLNKRGAYVTVDLGGEPIVLVCDEKGEIRAMSNVCRHRAAVIMRNSEGCAERLRCRYHGWTYDLCGRLRGLPEWDGVQDFAKEEQGLPTYEVDTWGPLVWVRLARTPGASLREHLAPLPSAISDAQLAQLSFAERRDYTLACNWKVFVDNYLDGGYHVNTVHPGLAGVIDYTKYRTEVHGFTSLQRSPLVAPDGQTTATSAVRTGTEAQYWWVFPNFMLNFYEGMLDTNWVIPLGPEKCRVVIDFFFAKKDGAEKSIAVGHEIQLEDVGICEDVQRGLRSASYDKGRFSVRREIAGHHFHKLLAEQLTRSAP